MIRMSKEGAPSSLSPNAKTNKSRPIPTGVWPVMLTPFDADGKIDWRALDALVDWYIDAGVAGLFSVCLSSEMYELSPDERLRLAAAVVGRAGNRVPVVAAGAFGDSTATQAEAAARLCDLGVKAVVLTVNQLAAEHESDDVWRQRAEAISTACDGIPLGLYECPAPYHRTLSPELLGWAANTGRFLFYKDTCCDLSLIQRKLAAIEGTPLAWFNAHAPTLLDSLKAGGCGYSSIAANFIPKLYVWLCEHFDENPERASQLQAFLVEAQNTITVKYPRNAKCHLQRLGLPINPHCRVDSVELSGPELQALDTLQEKAADWERSLHDSSAN